MSASQDLREEILRWDIGTDYKTFLSRQDFGEACRPLPDRFLDESEYIKSFRNPALMELKASILSTYMVESTTTIPVSVHLPKQADRTKSKKMKSETIDIQVRMVETQTASVAVDTLCVIRNSNKSSELPKILAIVLPGRSGGNSLNLRVLDSFVHDLSDPSWTYYLQPVSSLVSAAREIEALHSIGNLPLRDEILLGMSNATIVEKSAPPVNERPVPELVMDALGQRLNLSQMDVIDDLSASNDVSRKPKIFLIRGPPGSGKTMTLNAILNAIHVQQYNRYYDAIAEAVRNGRISNDQRTWLDITKISKPRIIVCAPSNVAIDNIILRISSEKFLDGECRQYVPRIVRIGKGSENNPEVAKLALSRLVDKLVSKPGKEIVEKIAKLELVLSEYCHGVLVQVTKLRCMIGGTPHVFRAGIETRVHTTPDGLFSPYWADHTAKTTSNTLPLPALAGEPICAPVDQMPEYLLYARELMKFLELWETTHWKLQRYRLVHMYQQESAAASSSGQSFAEKYQLQHNLETLLMNQASIVCGTLNSSGLPQVRDSSPFHTCVVDEAAQSVELSTLIPLRLGVRQLVLVGDPQQLPATVIGKRESLGNYERSLFERLEVCGVPVHTLSVQYRMHPAISHFPRHVFYQGILQDAPSVVAQKPPFFAAPPYEINPFMFINIVGGRDSVSASTQSRSNPDEAKICVSLYSALAKMAEANNINLTGRVGIISPYADQVRLLRSEFEAAKYDAEVASIDSYQGKEKDIIIVSTVRACPETNSVGFLSDMRRMNVAITRAKIGLFIVGRADTLSINPTWSLLVDNARRTRNAYLELQSSSDDVLTQLTRQIFTKAVTPPQVESLYPQLH